MSRPIVPSEGSEAFAAWREAQGLSRAEAAQALGCSYFWVRLIELGRRPGDVLQLLIESQTGIPPEAWERPAEAA